MKCEYCPLKKSDIPCMGDELGHTPACDSVNPDKPTYNPAMITAVMNHSIDLYNKKNNPHLIPEPTFYQKVSNFIGSMGDVIKSKGETVSEEIYQARLEKCEQCDFLKKENWTCSHPSCGCYLYAKAKLTVMVCPVGKWGLEFVSELNQINENKARDVSVDKMMKESIVVDHLNTVNSGNSDNKGCGCSGK